MCRIAAGRSIGAICRRLLRAAEFHEYYRRVVAIKFPHNTRRTCMMMRKGLAITILSGLIFLLACHDPAADTSKATTGEAAHVASPAVAQGQKYSITPQNSKVEFIGSKVTGHHNGSFGEFSGQVDYAGSPENSRVNITI